MALLRRYALGDAPVAFQVLSDQAANFAAGRVNFEDPHAAVALPVFAVHGNHDDPTRDGGVDALAALDVLSVAGLVNYFAGRCDAPRAVERGARVARRAPRGPATAAAARRLHPVLLRKGSTRVALGLGNVRDGA
ncbi:hypothetical protein SO694_0005217 [Aureococcus anophagefferens]|uniref:Calcineurin-like phosphoesterase domain-containing protein n=1 Tax=Aureococcus anophagefferens TaxID=44056 RepID=A0ABR1FY21_AURAN